MPHSKEQLRRHFKKQRLAMNRQAVLAKSLAIAGSVAETLYFTGNELAHVYSTIDQLYEVDTAATVLAIRQRYPGIVLDFGGQVKSGRPPSREYDLIIAPVLAFDEDKFRLGWGGGWYDRFLAAQPQALKVGLAFQNSFVKSGLPREPHDIKLDKIITESRVY
jgi:5-formyltetrahydrofolate cyclo-ligase